MNIAYFVIKKQLGSLLFNHYCFNTWAFFTSITEVLCLNHCIALAKGDLTNLARLGQNTEVIVHNYDISIVF